jgi:mRNA-degrading endonuclease toxin of MazEF toxin-antitoxin module
MCEQVRTIDKRRLGEKIGFLNNKKQDELDRALCISLGLSEL